MTSAQTLWGEPAGPVPEPEQPPVDPQAGAEPVELVGDQPAIWDAEPEPRQLALLPEPEPWEADRPPRSPASETPGGQRGRGGRLSRRRGRSAAAQDQLSLF